MTSSVDKSILYTRGEENHQIYKSYIFLLAIISQLTLVGFSVANFLNESILLGGIEAGLALIVFGAIIAMLITKQQVYGEYAATVVVLVLVVSLVISGGFMQSGISWIFVLPAISFFTLKLKGGAAMSFAFLLFMWVVTLLQYFGYFSTAYYTSTLILFSISYIVFSFMVYIYQLTIEQTIKQLKSLLTQQELFNEILLAGSNIKNIKDYSQSVIEKIVDYFEMDSGGLFTHSLGDEYIELIASHKITPQVLPLIQTMQLDDPAYISVLKDHKAMYMKSLKEADPTRGSFSRMTSAVMLPVMYNDVLKGAIVLASKRVFKPTASEKDILDRVSREIGIAFEKYQSQVMVEEDLV